MISRIFDWAILYHIEAEKNKIVVPLQDCKYW